MKTAIVVEDDPTILMYLEDSLTSQGYDVVSARSSGEALNMLGSGAYEITILIVDIRLSAGLDGWDIARCGREIKPDLPVVYVTGDSAREFRAEGVSRSILLQKPFTSTELTQAIISLTP